MLESFKFNFDKSQISIINDKYSFYKPACEYDKKSALEQSIRQYLLKLIKTPGNENLLNIQYANIHVCSVS